MTTEALEMMKVEIFIMSLTLWCKLAIMGLKSPKVMAFNFSIIFMKKGYIIYCDLYCDHSCGDTGRRNISIAYQLVCNLASKLIAFCYLADATHLESVLIYVKVW